MLPDLLRFVSGALEGLAAARRVLGILGPVTPAADLVGPLMAIASVLGLALLTGLAVGSLATLIVTLFALYVVLTEVFGVSIDVART